MGARVHEHQPEHHHAPPRSTVKRSLVKWLGLATAGALLLGTAPAAGSLPAPNAALPPSNSPSSDAQPSSSVQPVFAMVAGTSPLRDPTAGSGSAGMEWSPGYQPEITSSVSPDGSPADGEGIPSRRGVDHVTTGPTGLLPGGLALSAPVESTRITSGFGWRLNPTGPGSYIHIGQDYGVACGTPVRAAAAGRVVQSAWAGHSGQRVRVDHGSGVETAYSHNSLLVASKGERVQRGDLLALSGTTGNSTGCHVHFEVYLNGKWVDPAKYLPLLPGQKRPVSGQELRQIAQSRLSPAPSPRPSTNTTASGSTTPPAARQNAQPSTAAVSKTPTAAGPAPKAPRTPKPMATAGPTPSTAPTPSQVTKDPEPPQQKDKKPAQTPTTPSAAAPSTAAPPKTTPPAGPVQSPAPTKKPTTKPTPPNTLPPQPTPTPTPTPDKPTPTPDPGTTVPPTLSQLCLAYTNEDLEATEAHEGHPKPRKSRLLNDVELGFLRGALDAHPSAAENPQTEELKPPLSVHDVVDHCGEWFPQKIDEDTTPADIAALVTAAALKIESARDADDSQK